MFSVILPVWNRAALIGPAIESVLAQSLEDFELIIVDDGSTDDLAATLAGHDDPRIRSVRLEHGGLSRARNHGLALATRPFIAHLDSDNRWRPDFLRALLERLQQPPAARAAYCLARRHVHGEAADLPPSGIIGDRFSLRRLLEGNYIDINCFVHARELAVTAGGFDTSLKRLIDWDFILRIGQLTEPAYLPEVLVDYHYGLASNAVSLAEPLGSLLVDIRQRHQPLAEPVVVTHDSVTYRWQRVPDRKHDNWVRMRTPAIRDDAGPPPGMPWLLQIEPTNACNLACDLCPVSDQRLGRPTRHLGLDEFRALLDDMEDYLLLLVLWDWGEPLLNPQFAAMVADATRRDIRTVTSSNAHHLNHGDTASALMDAGLSTLIVAIDSPDPEAYRAFRRGGQLELALRGLERAVEAKRQRGAQTLINMRTVVTRSNEVDLDRLRRMALDAGADLFTVKTLNPSCGPDDRDDDLVPQDPALRRYAYQEGSWTRIRDNTPCTRPWHMANILSNGSVIPCCYDYDASMSVGNIREQAFSDLWRGHAFQQLRQTIRDQQQSLEKCRHCGVNFRLGAGWMIDAAASSLHTEAPIPPSPASAFADYDAWQQLADSRKLVAQLQTRLEQLQSPRMERAQHTLGRWLPRWLR